MDELVITRLTENEYGTFGAMVFNGKAFCVTLENEWKDNRVEVSCIPLGEYECERVNSPKYGDTFEVKDVEGRTHILFHAGNWVHNTLGCILLGEQFGMLLGKEAILNSVKTFKAFMLELKDKDKFKLTIKGQ